ncbi:MAG TPA: hypothetical protein VM099_04540 [Gemmatimonadaceae bacterium]|nr:hypothetical protein [Gemmatimonadaceae bacterium]
MLNRLLTSFAIVVIWTGNALAQSKVITPTGTTTKLEDVSVQGTVQYGEFFGAPSYGQNTASDRKERVFYLQLPAPITLQNRDLPLGPEFERPNEFFVQLHTTSTAMTARLRRMVGAKVRATGSVEPFSAGRDRTGIVMNIKTVSTIRDWAW